MYIYIQYIFGIIHTRSVLPLCATIESYSSEKNGAAAVRKMEKSIDYVTSLLFTVRGEALLIISIILLAVSFYGFKSIVCLRNH